MSKYFEEGMPLPAFERDTQEFWDGCREHKLLIQRCDPCGEYRHTPTPACSQCPSFEHSLVESAGLGEVWSFIIVPHAVHPAVRATTPYNAVIVQLNDCGGVKLTSNVINCKNEDLYIGMPVKVTWEDRDDDLTVYRFEPAG